MKTRYFIFISLIVSSLCLGLPAQDVRWDGPDMEQTGWVYTDEGYLGWIWCGTDGRSDWIYPQEVGDFIYLPVNTVRDAGGWGYTTDLEPFYLIPAAGDGGVWYSSWTFGGWVYAPEVATTAGSGWIYLMNRGGALPLAPEEIVLQAANVADHEAAAIADRYAQAIRIPADYISRFAEVDADIEITDGPEGVTFTNTTFFTGGRGNRFVRIGFHDGVGYLDFTALKNISGYGGIVLHADVDLSKTSNGFYVRVKRDDTDVAAYERLSSGEKLEDILLEPYMTNDEDDAYIEIILPWQGSVTIKDIYLYMDSKVRGFANMEENITGGAGATPDNIRTVTNAAEFADALQAVKDAAAPSIIYVAGTVTFEDWEAAGQSGREASINSSMRDLSIIGVEDQGMLDGVGVAIQGTNIIIQNLTVRYVLARDAIQVNNGRFVRIDHCTLYNEPFDINPDKDKFDELISIKNNAQSVIVSWNEIYNTHKTILVGSNDAEDAQPDRKVIFHHNWFHDGGSRHPLYRGGYAHVYNNYYQNIDSAINVRTNAKILIENNYFENVDGAVGYWFDTSNPAGGFEVSDNIYVDVDDNKPTTSTLDIQFAGDYQYTLDPVEEVPDIVTAGAGAGKLHQ